VGLIIKRWRLILPEVELITLGSVTGTARVVVDKMRDEDRLVGLLKIRYMRPFPVKDVTLM